MSLKRLLDNCGEFVTRVMAQEGMAYDLLNTDKYVKFSVKPPLKSPVKLPMKFPVNLPLKLASAQAPDHPRNSNK